MDKAEAVLKDVEREGEKKLLPIIGPEKGAFLDDAVMRAKPKRVLEVGTLVGYSAIRIGRLLEKGAKITCVERDKNYAKIARKNFERAGLSDRIEIIIGDAKRVLPTLTGEFDLVFLDATKDEYFAYLKLAEPRLHKGSVVVADNVRVFADAMKDFLDYVRHSGKYKSEYHEAVLEFHPDVRDGVEVSIRL
jgi:predicted O-methyltransferase YrrM